MGRSTTCTGGRSQTHLPRSPGLLLVHGSRVKPGLERERTGLEIYGKEYDVHWGEVTNTFTKVTRTVARAWIQGKAWAGKGENRAGNLWEGVRRALGGGHKHIYQGH